MMGIQDQYPRELVLYFYKNTYWLKYLVTILIVRTGSLVGFSLKMSHNTGILLCSMCGSHIVTQSVLTPYLHHLATHVSVRLMISKIHDGNLRCSQNNLG